VTFDYEYTLGTVWKISLQQIDARSMQLLRILTYLDPDAVAETLFRKGAREHSEIQYLSHTKDWLKTSRILRKQGLCSKANTFYDAATSAGKPGSASQGIATHKLVLELVFRTCSEVQRQEALAQVVALLRSEFPAVSDSQFRLSSFWRECHVLLPQVAAVIERCQSTGLELPYTIVPVVCACGRYLIERRSFEAAENMFNVAQQVCQAHNLQNWEQAQFVKRSLGGIILESSALRSNEAVRMFEEVVSYYEESLAADDPVLGVAYSDLAQALSAKAEYDKAISLCEKALSITAGITCDKTQRDTRFHIHHNMGRIYEMKGMPDEALRLHLFEGDEQGNGLREERSVYGAWNLYAVGNCLQLQKNPRAMETHAKALRIRQELFANHYYTAMSYHKIGQLHLDDGAHEEASGSFQEAEKILCDPLGDTQAELARTLWYWSIAKEGMLKTDEASDLKRRAVDISDCLLGRQGGADRSCTNKDFDELVVYYHR
jgi:tetratricopeptide (TPR) repeat protein